MLKDGTLIAYIYKVPLKYILFLRTNCQAPSTFFIAQYSSNTYYKSYSTIMARQKRRDPYHRKAPNYCITLTFSIVVSI